MNNWALYRLHLSSLGNSKLTFMLKIYDFRPYDRAALRTSLNKSIWMNLTTVFSIRHRTADTWRILLCIDCIYLLCRTVQLLPCLKFTIFGHTRWYDRAALRTSLFKSSFMNLTTVFSIRHRTVDAWRIILCIDSIYLLWGTVNLLSCLKFTIFGHMTEQRFGPRSIKAA